MLCGRPKKIQSILDVTERKKLARHWQWLEAPTPICGAARLATGGQSAIHSAILHRKERHSEWAVQKHRDSISGRPKKADGGVSQHERAGKRSEQRTVEWVVLVREVQLKNEKMLPHISKNREFEEKNYFTCFAFTLSSTISHSFFFPLFLLRSGIFLLHANAHAR